MNNKLSFEEAKELNHKYLGEKNPEKKKVLKDKLILGTIPYMKKIIDDNYKDFNLGLYDLDDLYNGVYELWIKLINQDILYQVKSFDDDKILSYIFDRLPSTLAINELPYYMQDSLIVDSIYEYVKNHDNFDEKEFQKEFRNMIHKKHNTTKENDDRLFNYFYNKNYGMIEDIVKNYVTSKRDITKQDIARTIDVLTISSIDNSNLDNIAISNKTINDLFVEKNPLVKEIMSGLTPMERELVNYSYGINNYEKKSLLEVAELYGEPYEFILDVYAKAMEKMKAFYYCKYESVNNYKGR